MIPKEQKLEYFCNLTDGNIFDYIRKLAKDGYVVHQLIPDLKDMLFFNMCFLIFVKILVFV